MILAQITELLRLGFLDLDDHLRGLVEAGRIGQDFHTHLAVILIGITAEPSGIVLDIDRMALAHQVTGGIGDQGNTPFQYFNFTGNPNLHVADFTLLLALRTIARTQFRPWKLLNGSIVITTTIERLFFKFSFSWSLTHE